MKKGLWGLCLVVLSVLVLHTMTGENLQANDQPSNTVGTVSSENTAVPVVPEASVVETPAQESAPEVSTPTAPSVSTAPSSSATPESTTSSSSTTTEPSQSSEVPESSSSTEASSTESSSTESSTSSGSETSGSTTESSTVNSSTSTPPKEETSDTSESSSSTGNSQTTEESSSAPTTPSTPIVSVPEVTGGNTTSTNTSSLPTRTSSSESSLMNAPVTLDASLLVSEVAATDLNGFTLPLLNSFEQTEQGVLIYEGIKQLDNQEREFNNVDELLEHLMQTLFDQSLNEVEKNATTDSQAGDLLYQDDQLLGLYLGEDHYLTVAEKSENETGPLIALVSDLNEAKINYQSIQNVALNEYGEAVKKAYPASMDFSENKQTQDFIDTIAEDARELGLNYDVFASVMIAQAILESGSGSSQLASAPNYNLFGIKGSFNGETVSFATQEDRGSGDYYTIQAAFRKYPNYGQSLGDYVTLLRSGIVGNEQYYQGAWRSQAKNYLKVSDFLTGKYATDSQYNKKISSIIALYQLTQYDEPKAVENTGTPTSVVLQNKDQIPETYRKLMKFPDYNGYNYNVSGSYPVGQCTWYAYNRVAQLGYKVDEYMGNGGEWGTKGKKLGYTVRPTPQAGWLISFSPGTAGSSSTYGHVAFVEAVGSDGILISEGNVMGGTTVSYRVIGNEIAKSSAVSYIQPK